MRRSPLRTIALSLVMLGFATPQATADLITFNLDHSNTLASRVVYGTVTLQSFPNLGEVQLTYTADPTVYSSVGKNFGFHTIGFNTDLALSASQVTLPTGWSLTPNANLSMFGVFGWKATTTNHEGASVTVQIDGLGTNATLDHFTLPSQGGDSAFFAGHIMDFSIKGRNVTSQWVGASSVPPVPPPGGQGGPPSVPPPGGQGGPLPQAAEPPTVAMGAVAVFGVALARLRRRRRGA